MALLYLDRQLRASGNLLQGAEGVHLTFSCWWMFVIVILLVIVIEFRGSELPEDQKGWGVGPDDYDYDYERKREP